MSYNAVANDIADNGATMLYNRIRAYGASKMKEEHQK